MNVNDLFPAKWLTPADLKGRSAVVEVEHVTLEDVFNPRTRQGDKKLAIAFKGARKRMLLNKTQAFAFAAACASTESAHWVGCRVQLSVGIAPNKAETIVVSAPPDLPASPAPQPPTNGATPPKSARTKTPLPPDPSGMGTAHAGRCTVAADEDTAGADPGDPPDLPVIYDEDSVAAGDD
jgi:hypothetical protein